MSIVAILVEGILQRGRTSIRRIPENFKDNFLGAESVSFSNNTTVDSCANFNLYSGLCAATLKATRSLNRLISWLTCVSVRNK